MPEKRMISSEVTDEEECCDLPATAQALYFRLIIKADDHGFVRPGKIIRDVPGASDKDIDKLVESGYLIRFEDSKAMLITDWWRHNKLDKSKMRETDYRAEFSLVYLGTDRRYVRGRLQQGQHYLGFLTALEIANAKTNGEKIRSFFTERVYERDPIGTQSGPQDKITQGRVTQENVTQENVTQHNLNLGEGSNEGGGPYTREQLRAISDQQKAQYERRREMGLNGGEFETEGLPW